MSLRFAEHPIDVLGAFEAWCKTEKCALVVMINTSGGAVRNKGALLAVSETGRSSGYISGGCIDSDVILQAQNAIRTGQAKTLKYGVGSPFVDLPLPCGGAIDLLVIPNPDTERLSDIRAALINRLPVRVDFHSDGTILRNAREENEDLAVSVIYQPKLRLRIAGRGADCLALARLAKNSDMEVQLRLTSDADIEDANAEKFANVEKLSSPQSLPSCSDDPWTAFVLAFHDIEWEGVLLKQALSGAAFYVGAVGSRRTQEKRRLILADMGVAADEIARIRGPVGVVPALRDASRLAISVLAEIIDCDRARNQQPFQTSAVLLLAAGASSRFSDGDKLLADLDGEPVLRHVAKIADILPFKHCIAIVDEGKPERSEILKSSGWETLHNPNTKNGIATSITLGIQRITAMSDVDSLFILLADMPYISASNLVNMMMKLSSGTDAVMSCVDGKTTPPAAFSRHCFTDLAELSGDQGAKSLFTRIENRQTIEISRTEARDIDTVQDLKDLTSRMDPYR
jgi:xanthine/CO dehydrogenase XdhC/CoxF family maturation factor/CTP:molybdopterin cytidylyltransferase MocA